MKIKITSLSLFFLLAISSIAVAAADSMELDYNHAKNSIQKLQNIDQTQSSNLQSSNELKIYLEEKLAVSTDDPSEKENILPESQTQKSINLFEELVINTSSFDRHAIITAKNNSDRQTTMDRIWNAERIRFNGKLSIQNEFLENAQQSTNLIYSDRQLTEQLYNNNHLENSATLLNNIVFTQSIVKEIPVLPNEQLNTFFKTGFIDDNLVAINNDIIDAKNPTILLLLVPLLGYVLIRSGEENLEFYNSRKILSFSFALILISSIAVTPISVSSSYWHTAYAEQMSDNSTALSIPDNSTALSIPDNSTALSIPDNSTALSIPDNSTALSIPDNSTALSIPDNSTALSIPDNSTALSIPDNSTALSIPDNSTALSIPDNSTALSIPDNSTLSEIEQTVPNVTQSWQFDNSTLGANAGDIELEQGVNGTSLNLQEGQYLTQNITSTNELLALSISAWVKPDYSKGSPEFTVLSKENAFILSINNNLPPPKIAKFSIFDGIKWTMVESKTEINEEWTHIAATFDSTSISIYVNGKLESTQAITGIPTLAVNGQLKASNVDSISSDADIVIGAYLNTKKGQFEQSNSFSGLIDNVNLYDSLLEPSEIERLYSQDVLSIIPLVQPVNATIIQPVNATTLELDVVPQLASIKETYLITENPQIEFQYYSDIDILKLAQVEILQEQDQLSKSQEILNDTENNTRSENNLAQQQIQEALVQIQDAQELIQKVIEQPQTEGQIQEAIIQTQEAKAEIRDAQEQLQETGMQINEPTTSEPIQHDMWQGNKETINVEVYDSEGKSVDVQTEVKQVLDGKFDITFSSTRDATPGVFTVKTILTKDGQTYISEDEFAWGLVSLNTKKSIYRPGETADFVIVVLNSTGNPVCDSNIVMDITDPNSQTKSLSTVNGITQNENCGLYDANYTTSSEGNYTVNINAQTETGIASFSTSFLVQQDFAYDIVRTADSKIDPVNDPNLYDVNIDVESFVGSGQVTIREYVPRVFDITTDGQIQEINDTKIITWQRNLGSANSASVSYTYSVPVVYPKLYALGKVEIEKDNLATFTEARNWFVAVDPTVLIDGTPDTTDAKSQKSSKQIVCTSGTVCYDFYIDGTNNNVVYSKTTDSGTTWNTPIVINGTTPATTVHIGVAVWYDRWTPGDNTGNLIHIAYAEQTTDRIFYRNLDTSTDTLSAGPVDASGAAEGALGNANDVAITKGTDGDLYVGTVDATAPSVGANFIEKCTGSCTINTNWVAAGTTNPWDGSANDLDENHDLVLLPLSGGNIMLASIDITEEDLEYKIYTDSSNSWATDFTDLDTFTPDSLTFFHSLSGIVDKSTNTLYISYVNGTGTVNLSEVRVWSYTTGWNQLTDAWPNTIDSVSTIIDSTIGIDENTRDLYVVYIRDPTNDATSNRNVYFAKSSDNGVTWNRDNQINDLGTGDFRGISMTSSSDSLLYTTWHLGGGTDDRFGDKVVILRGLPESLAISDTLTKSTSKQLPESITVGETLTKSTSKQLSESITISDPPVNAFKTILVSLSESITVGETLTKSTSKQLPESITVGETLTKSTSKQLSESITISDPPVNAFKTILVSLSESITVGETLTKSTSKQLPESITVGETLTKSTSKQLSESITISDPPVNAFKTILVSLSESITVGETLTKSTSKQLPESIAVGETLTKSTSKQLSESIAISDPPVSAFKTILVSLSESITVGETLTKSTSKQLPESIAVGETLTKSTSKQLSESIAISDPPVSAFKTIPVSLSESITVSDSISKTQAFFRSLSETVSIPAGFSHKLGTTTTMVIEPGATATASISSTISMGFTIPSTSPTGTVVVTPTSVGSPTVSGSAISFLGNIMDLTLSGGSCAAGCPITFTFTDTDLATAGISSPSEVVIYRDSEEDGTFVALATTLIDEAPSPYTASATTTSTSFFGAGKAAAASGGGPAGGPSGGGTSGGGGASGHRTGAGPSGTSAGFGGILEPVKPIIPPIDPDAPKIFDVKYQLGNGTKFLASETTNKYVNYQSMSVSAIVDTPTPIKRAELRFIKLGQELNEYSSIVMDVKPLQISNTTYTISGTIPQRLMEGPAIVYWIHILNEGIKVQDSDKYTIGVKPDYSVDGNLELDIQRNRAEGTTATPILYFTNEAGEPVYGTISLVVDGKTVYTSPAQLFDVGETGVNLEWKTPNVDQVTSYAVQAKAEFYGKSFETKSTINTFPATRTVSLSQPSTIEIITDEDGNTVATPNILYASFKDEGNMRYRVIAPDGTCVIGGSEECLVTESTMKLPGNFKSITVGDQIYRVRYSGPANPLERFSITSIDPILGQWQAEIDSEDGLVPQAHAMKDAFFKVKYRAQPTPFVSEPTG